MQLAETEAFSLNSDRSSSILLGDDLSLEDPTACPLGPKDSKVNGPVGFWANGCVLAGWPPPAQPEHCSFSGQHLSGIHCGWALISCWSAEGGGAQRGGVVYLKSQSSKPSQGCSHASFGYFFMRIRRPSRCLQGSQSQEESEQETSTCLGHQRGFLGVGF